MVGGLSIPAAGRARRLDLCVRMIEPAFAIGDEVSVKASCILFHIPGHKEGRDAQGMVGTVARVYNEPNLSPIQPVKVSFTDPKPWTGHFEFSELEFANGPNDAPAEGSHASAAAPPTGLSGGDSVAECMTLVDKTVVLSPEMPLRQAAELLTANGITGAPVVSEGKLVGVLTQFDFLYQEAGTTSLELGSPAWRSAVQKSLAGTVSAAMTREPITVPPGAEMSEVAALMVRKRFNHLVVVDGDDTVLGLVTSPDVLRHVLARLSEGDAE